MNVLTLDFETYFDDDYTLSKMTTENYIRDPRFEAHGVGLRLDNDKSIWIEAPEPRAFRDSFDWDNTTVLCHHAAFDGLILSHHYGVCPARWLDTYSMAAMLFGPGQGRSLDALASRFGLAPKTMPYDLMKGRQWVSLSDGERRQVADGCLHDCELTYTIFERMMRGDY